MGGKLKGRSLLTLKDYSAAEIRFLLDSARVLKAEKRKGRIRRRFRGKTLALLFEKRSTRTRCAFETAFGEEGGHPVFLSTQDVHLGAKESLEDTARVLGRMFDCIQYRGYDQRTVETLAEYSRVPVYNGLTDSCHPTQALADLFTVEECTGGLAGKTICYTGDGRNNVAVSLVTACAKMGVNLVIASPRELHPSPALLKTAGVWASESGANITVETDPLTAVKGADVIYTDVWVSMGEEKQTDARVKLLTPYQVNEKLMAATGNKDVKFLHCLPAVRGQEVTQEVIDGPQSAAWDQAENRKHVIKAILLATL
ncbi:MAG: ornithine carbamoyltransferase [Spirochaetales bacterium]|nr:ornithine carbamoyltransferase [Spirochaetales bacterium]